MKNGIVFCVSVLFGLLIVEVGLRLFDPLNFQPHESRAVANVPLINGEHYFCKGGPVQLAPHPVVYSRDTPNQSYFEFRNDIVSFMDINEYGFRGEIGPSDAQNRVIVLGDSFIRGTLADETETIPALLSRWSQDTHFVNLGTGGHGTLQHALTYDEFKDRIPHEAVLLFVFSGNDLVDNIRFRAWQQDPEGSNLHEPTAMQSLKQMVAQLYVGKLLQLSYSVLFDQNRFPSVPTEEEGELLSQSLAELSQAVADQGARLFVFSLPDVSEFVGRETATFRENPVEYGDATRALIRQAAQENGFVYLELKDVLVEKSREMNVPTSTLFGSPDHHLREVGNFAVAEAVAGLLEDEGVAFFVQDNQLADLTHFDPSNVICP